MKIRGDAFERGGDGGIVGSGGGEVFLRQPPLGFEREPAAGAGKFFGNSAVVGRRCDNRNIVKIFGGGADHGRSADVDVLDQIFEGHARLGGGFLEGVEIYHDHVNRLDAVLGNGGGVR